jgi:hypothetical protein
MAAEWIWASRDKRCIAMIYGFSILLQKNLLVFEQPLAADMAKVVEQLRI